MSELRAHTHRHLDVMLAWVREYMDMNGRPPSIREIRDGLGISSTSVVDYRLRALARRGDIRRKSGPRHIGLTSDPECVTGRLFCPCCRSAQFLLARLP